MKLELRGITKRFGQLVANDSINLVVQPGEIHALLGENGAGKSTTVKILTGIYTPNGGTIRIDGEAVAFSSPNVASEAGITAIHQETVLFDELSVGENIFIGHAPRTPFGLIDTTKMHSTAKALLDGIGAPFSSHTPLRDLGIDSVQVRTPADLESVDALVMPGGESTTMSHLLQTSGLFDAIDARLKQGMPVFGTCAGMILLAKGVLDGRSDQRSFGAIDIDVKRNAYGRQIDSFETDISLVGLVEDFHAVFIRAPQIARIGEDVTVLARHNENVVLARQGSVMVASFHPELTNDARIHSMFIGLLQEV